MENHYFARLARGFLPLALISIVAAGCDVADPSGPPPRLLRELSHETLITEQRRLVNDAVDATLSLANATRSFLSDPNTETRSVFQRQWITAHEQYLKAAILQGPINPRLDVDQWPVHAGFFDSLAAYPGSGIISDEKLAMTAETLREQHQITSDEEVALGFHVLEYYAFERPLADFKVDAQSDSQDGPQYSERRIRFVRIVSDLLSADMMAYRSSLDNDPASRLPQSFPALIDRLHNKLQMIFSEANLLGQHSPYAGRSGQDIAVQLRQIQSLLEEPIALNRYLLDRNPKTTEVFHHTLNEVIQLLPESGTLGDEASSRLLLLTAALSHQLEEFQRLSSREGEI